MSLRMMPVPVPTMLLRSSPRPHPTAVHCRRVAGIAVLALALGGCANPFKPYRFEIQQGNFVSSEMVGQLKTGMTRDQVRYTLGSPMVTPLFRADQWHYVFYQRKTSGDMVERRLTLYFQDGQLARWEGDAMPSERPQPDAETASGAKAS